ncbi:hypothetical protein H1230_16455 [Paenibacillus sp. 19GGS1-52]|uniref:hypothetical protein n=1 Tax=Paenibacillus sp. 19GGS1-52 TaxID=2758563 RepID=UPI001EFBE3F3|nr:hypothetical protein [Paenibacillus sp. 19GGS1-52]ULO04755.1 hypothetical protein H1230_16455 [Paenibacillus sp. 19GGS1-52]
MSNYNEKVFNEQIHILRDFLFHYSGFRLLHQEFDNLIKFGSQDFWIYTINAHYLQAINLWCMVFGTNTNETHWKKLGLIGDFKSIILSSLELDDDTYTTYWESVKNWRNKYSAHRIPDFSEPTPDLKLARTVALLYEDWVSTNIDDSINFSLKSYEVEFNEEIRKSFMYLLSPLSKEQSAFEN